MDKKVSFIGGATLLISAFAFAAAGLVAPPEEWLAWAIPACTLLIGGLGALAWGSRDKLSFRLDE